MSLTDYENLVNIRVKYNGLLNKDLVETIYLTDGYMSTSRFDHDKSVEVKKLKEVESEVIEMNLKQREEIDLLRAKIDALRNDVVELHKLLPQK